MSCMERPLQARPHKERLRAMLGSADSILRTGRLLKGLQEGQAANMIILGGPVDGRGGRLEAVRSLGLCPVESLYLVLWGNRLEISWSCSPRSGDQTCESP